MMKKNVTLMITSLLVLMFSLTGCGSDSAEMDNLRQQVTSLEEQVEKLEEKQELYDNMIAELQSTVSNASQNPTDEKTNANSEESNAVLENGEVESATEVDNKEDLMEYLEEQIKSDDFDNWLEVAECDYVTSKQLLTIAEKCVAIDYYDGYYSRAESGQNKLADAIIANSAVTDEVLRQLAESEYVSIWLKVISSEECSTITLFEVAQKCVAIDYYDGYYSRAENGQTLLADAILESPVLNDDVVRKLLDSKYPSIWFKALASDKCSEETLILAAQMCVAIDYYDGYYSRAETGQLEMAEIILQNPALTENVLKEFINSEYSSVVSLGHQNIETITQTNNKK